MGCRFGWLVGRGVCDQGGAAHNRFEKPASRFARSWFFVRSLSASSELVRPFRAQKSPKHLLEAFRICWRSEGDYSRRMMGCRFGWLVGRGVCDQGGAAHNRFEKPASRFARSWFFVRSLSASSELVRPFRAQKSPKHLLEAFRICWRSEADSNRCSSFCRAEPSHSAIGPFPCGVDKYTENSGQGYNSERTKCTFAA